MKKHVTFLIFSLAILSSKAQWELVQGPVDAEDSFGGMSFVNDSTGFVVQRFDDWPIVRSLILKTIDYGVSWDTIYSIVDTGNQFIPNFKDVFFINENEGWVCGTNMLFILHTEDGGDTWIQQDITSTELIEAEDADFELIKFYDENYGVALNRFSGQHAIETFDGGGHWNVNDSLTGNDASFIDQCNYHIISPAYDKRRENCNLTYQTVPAFNETEGYSRSGRCLQVFDNNNWIFGTQGLVGLNSFGSILKTNDGGSTFQVLNLFFVDNVYCFEFIDEDKGFAALTSISALDAPCSLLKTLDSGITWYCQETPIIQYLQNSYYVGFTDIECPSSSICYANNGQRIFRTFNGGGPLGEIWTGVDETKSPISEQALQLFPNPTSNQITIAGLPQNSICDIRIYDASGREVLAHLNSAQNIIQIDHLIAGIYFITITSNDGINQLRFIKE